MFQLTLLSDAMHPGWYTPAWTLAVDRRCAMRIGASATIEFLPIPARDDTGLQAPVNAEALPATTSHEDGTIHDLASLPIDVQLAVLRQVKAGLLGCCFPLPDGRTASALQAEHLELTMALYLSVDQVLSWLALLNQLLADYVWDWYNWLPVLTHTLSVCYPVLLAQPDQLVQLVDSIYPNAPSSIAAATEPEKVLCQLFRALQPTLHALQRNLNIPSESTTAARSNATAAVDATEFLSAPDTRTFEAVMRPLSSNADLFGLASACMAVLRGTVAAFKVSLHGKLSVVK